MTISNLLTTLAVQGATIQNVGKDTAQKNDTLITNINTIINTVIGILGVVAVIVIIIGGIGYMTSSGDANKVKKAKDTILYGVIGLVIVALAFAITNFVISTILK